MKSKYSAQLKPCPCGKIPKELNIYGDFDGAKWAYVSSDCCGDWELEFRTQYSAWESEECKQYALERWNGAKRNGEKSD